MSMLFNILAGQVAAGEKLVFDPTQVLYPGGDSEVTVAGVTATIVPATYGNAYVASSNANFGDLNSKFGVYFKLGNSDMPASDGDEYAFEFGICSDDYDLSTPALPSSWIAATIVIGNNSGSVYKQVYSIGNIVAGDMATPVTPLTINSETEFCIAYDADASTYGTVYFYSSENPNTPVAQYALTAAHTEPAQVLLQFQGILSTNSVTIVRNPTVEHTGVRNVGA